MECSSFFVSLLSSVFSLGGAARAVIALLHTDMHQRGTVGSIGHLATSVITVGPGTKADEAVAKITKRLKSGKVIQDVGTSTRGLSSLPELTEDAQCIFCLFFFVPRRKFSGSEKISQSCYRAELTKPGPNTLILWSRRCSVTHDT